MNATDSCALGVMGSTSTWNLSPQAKAAPRGMLSPSPLNRRGPSSKALRANIILRWWARRWLPRSPDGVTADLILESVIALDGLTSDIDPGIPIGNSFVLTFRGPLSPVLPSVTVEMTPPSAAPKRGLHRSRSARRMGRCCMSQCSTACERGIARVSGEKRAKYRPPPPRHFLRKNLDIQVVKS